MEKQTLREYLNWYQGQKLSTMGKSQVHSQRSSNRVQKIEEKLQGIKKMMESEISEQTLQKVYQDLNKTQQNFKQGRESTDLNSSLEKSQKKTSKFLSISGRRSKPSRKLVEDNENDDKENIARNNQLVPPDQLGESIINMKLSVIAPRELGDGEVLRQIYVTNKSKRSMEQKQRRPKKLVSFLPPELSRKNINFFDLMEQVSTRNIRM